MYTLTPRTRRPLAQVLPRPDPPLPSNTPLRPHPLSSAPPRSPSPTSPLGNVEGSLVFFPRSSPSLPYRIPLPPWLLGGIRASSMALKCSCGRIKPANFILFFTSQKFFSALATDICHCVYCMHNFSHQSQWFRNIFISLHFNFFVLHVAMLIFGHIHSSV